MAGQAVAQLKSACRYIGNIAGKAVKQGWSGLPKIVIFMARTIDSAILPPHFSQAGKIFSAIKNSRLRINPQ